MSQHNYQVEAAGHAQVHNGNNINNINNNNTSITIGFRQQAGTLGVKNGAKVLAWFSSLNFELAHARIRDEAGLEDRGGDESEDNDYTGRWLWELTALDQWRNREIRELWYTGMPGAGKSTLASIIIERMLKLQKSFNQKARSGRVAYIYISHNESYTIDHLLGSVIHQAVKSNDVLPRSVTDFHTEFNEKETSRKTTHALADLIHKLSMEEPIYIIVDAIDEADAGLGQDLISLLRPRGKNESDISLLVTSQVWRDFDHLSKHFHREPIAADSKDLQLFIDHMFRSHGSLRQLLTCHPKIRDEMRHLITWKCKQIFLLAKLQVQTLLPSINSRSLSYEDLSIELRQLLPAALDLDQMYAEISERILNRKDEDKDAQRAYRILAWVVFSPRQLSVPELREAMCLDSATKDLGDPEHQSTQDTIRDICDGLVTFYQGEIRYVHYTTQVYFRENARRLFGGFQAHIACVCAAYLCTQGLEKVMDSDQIQYHDEGTASTPFTAVARSSLDSEAMYFSREYSEYVKKQLYYAREILSRFPLLPYALEYLGHHLREHSEGHLQATEKHVVSVLDDGSKMTFLYRWLQLMNLIQPRDQRRLYRFRELNPLRIYPDDKAQIPSTSLRTTSLADYVSSRPSTASDPQFRSQILRTDSSSLSHATINSIDALETEDVDMFLNGIMEFLGLESQQPHQGGNGLEAPSGSNNVCDNGVIAEGESGFTSADEDPQNPSAPPLQSDMSITGKNNIGALAKLPSELLRAGCGRPTTPTHLAAWYGYIPILKHFLDTQKDLGAADEFSRRPVVVALQQGHIDAVRICLDYGAEIDLSTDDGQQVLLQVSRRIDAKQSLVCAIIRQNHDRLDIMQQSDRIGMESLLKLPMFVACVAMVSATRLSAPIRKAFRLMHYGNSIMGLYRRLNSDNVLAAAARGDASAIARMIAKGKWDVKTKSSRLGMLSVFVAVEAGSIDTVVALIDGGVDVNIQDSEGNTLLIRAMARGNANMVKALLDKNADVSLRNHKCQTAWTIFLKPENEEALDLLAARGGADPDAQYSNGEPVLYCHAAGGNLAFVEWLLEKGANPSNCTRCGWAPLHWAANSGHLECVEALLRHGAQHSPLSDTSLTPLDMAIQKDRTQIIRVLESQGAKRGTAYYQYDYVDRQPHRWSTQGPLDYYSSLFPTGQEEYEWEEEEDDASQSSTRMLDDIDVMHVQDGFEAIILRLEERVLVPSQTKKKVFEFFFRDIAEVLHDLEEFNGANHMTVSEDASHRWNTIVAVLKQRDEITKMLQVEDS